MSHLRGIALPHPPVPRVRLLLLSCAIVLCLLLSSIHVASAAALLKRTPTELYDVLGVPASASPTAIKKAFRQLAREHHPDLQDSVVAKEDAKVSMTALLRAYEVLSDPQKRQSYDSSGVVPGEEYTSSSASSPYGAHGTRDEEDDLLNRFRQRAPIVSRTSNLDSLTALRRLRQFRGWRVFVIQIYDDDCRRCRDLAPAWEALSHSPLVQAGAMKLYRVDGHSEGGAAVARALGVHYASTADSKKDPVVEVIVNGVEYGFTQLSNELQRGAQQSTLYQALVDFVMMFFNLAQQAEWMLSSNSLTNGPELLRYLSSPLPHASQQSPMRMPDAQADASHVADAPPPQEPSVVRILVPHGRVALEALAPALQMHFAGQIHVRRITRETLRWFVEEYCHKPIRARDRGGYVVPTPDFIVAAQQQLETTATAAAAADIYGSDDSDSDSRCRGVHIGVSASLNYAKAAQFVEGMQPRVDHYLEHLYRASRLAHGDENTLPAVSLPVMDATRFYDRCSKHCVLWLRRDCEGGDGDGSAGMQLVVLHALAMDSASFATGYLCLRHHSELQRALDSSSGGVRSTSTTTQSNSSRSNSTEEESEMHEVARTSSSVASPLVVMMINGDDDNWYRMPVIPPLLNEEHASPLSTWSTSADVLAASQTLRRSIQAELAAWADQVAENHTADTGEAEGATADAETPHRTWDEQSKRVRLILSAPMTALLTQPQGITYSLPYRVYLSLMHCLPAVKKFASNTMPFVVMYFVHTRLIRPRQDTKNQASPSTAIPRPRRYVRRATATPPPPTNAVRTFHAVNDVAEARRGKGYLILILDRRPVAAGALTLPRTAENERFTIRVLGAGETKWREWVSELAASNEGEYASEAPVMMTVVAIRKQRMKAMVLERGASMESFLLDLLDGTRVPSVDVPASMLDE